MRVINKIETPDKLDHHLILYDDEKDVFLEAYYSDRADEADYQREISDKDVAMFLFYLQESPSLYDRMKKRLAGIDRVDIINMSHEV